MKALTSSDEGYVCSNLINERLWEGSSKNHHMEGGEYFIRETTGYLITLADIGVQIDTILHFQESKDINSFIIPDALQQLQL